MNEKLRADLWKLYKQLLGVAEETVARLGEEKTSFFRVRLWTQKELLEAQIAHYDRLEDDLRAELPLMRIWTVEVQQEV